MKRKINQYIWFSTVVPKIAQMVELVDKNIKFVIIIVLYMFKKLQESGIC